MVLPERVARLQEKVAKIKGQMRDLSAIEKQLQSTQERQISLTDPDARSMATSRLGSAVVGYNVQAAVDAKHHMIVAHEVTNAVTDRGQLAAISKAAQEAIDTPNQSCWRIEATSRATGFWSANVRALRHSSRSP